MSQNQMYAKSLCTAHPGLALSFLKNYYFRTNEHLTAYSIT